MSEKLATGRALGVEICEALNIDASLVRGITFTVQAEGSDGIVAAVTVDRYVTDEQKNNLGTVLKRYALVPLPDTDAQEQKAA